MENRIEIELGDGNKLVAETCPEFTDYKEIYIGIENTNGLWIQDLAIVRQDYCYSPNIVQKHGSYEILVYGDENQEDYTNRFFVKLYEEV